MEFAEYLQAEELALTTGGHQVSDGQLGGCIYGSDGSQGCSPGHRRGDGEVVRRKAGPKLKDAEEVTVAVSAMIGKELQRRDDVLAAVTKDI
jgi:hypothetical protein